MTRAEFIKILMQAFGKVDDTLACTFSDVEKGTRYYGSIAAAQELGIAKGKSDGSFGINDEITRQDMAVMIYRMTQLLKLNLDGKSATSEFTDMSQVASYATEAVAAMQKSGLFTGVGNGRFAPVDHATRAQVAVIVYKLLKAGK